ncbi:cation:proton antiporter [Herbiconiux sp. CPCC 203407]|uniref:Cation:proton antiporter n=1 Tax=Herbiconiux oxytropis TaxID=2970915 RepID=A0AA41XIR0_9MICO|nr:cation:proton antiporter [Herbiconiux oxytropis]MCS5723542.1 cation:proton antiporter [Herbiconiux oxytropis]MCS5727468.1 cation:proton antiporter [Herbiconiux oxytropis]
MTELLVVLVGGFLVIAAATLIAPRLRIASPLVLVAVGVGASFIPLLGGIEIEPEWILAGILPPLLYSAAVSMPAMNFRREFGAISGLSVLLVVGTALLLGVFFLLVIPDLGFAWGVALGAIVSPTDAVATSIIKRTPVSRRVVAILDGESLLNDATALVLLRTAIVATAASFSFWGAVGTFAYSVVVAVVLGGLVGWLNLAVRRRVTDPTVNTVISFAVPFLAAVPAELLGASGLVAAVVAGLVTGIRAPRELSPQNRLSDTQNWRTVELTLEGAVFLIMGLQISSIIADVERDHSGVGPALLVALGALLLTVLVRAAYVFPLLGVLAWRSRRNEQLQPRLEQMKATLDGPGGAQSAYEELTAGRVRRGRRGVSGGRDGPAGRVSRADRARPTSRRQLDQFARRVTQGLADIKYFLRQPLGWREGTVVVWAGMRGAVTVAAAQTLPEDTPQRSALVLIAFAVAALSLVVQGGTVGPLVRRLSPQRAAAVEDAASVEESELEAERTELFALLRSCLEDIPEPPELRSGDRSPAVFDIAKRYRLQVLSAQRSALLDARDNGTFDADILAEELANLDASEIALEMRSRLPGS